MINSGMGRKRKRPATTTTNASSPPKSSYQEWKNDGLNPGLSGPPPKRPAVAAKGSTPAKSSSKGTLKTGTPRTATTSAMRLATSGGPGVSEEFTFTSMSLPQYARSEQSASAVENYQSRRNRQFSPLLPPKLEPSSQSRAVQGNTNPSEMASMENWSPQLPPIRVPMYTEDAAPAMYSSTEGIATYREYHNNQSLIDPYHPPRAGSYDPYHPPRAGSYMPSASPSYSQVLRAPQIGQPYGNYSYHHQSRLYNEHNPHPSLAENLPPMNNHADSSPFSYDGIEPFMSDASGEGSTMSNTQPREDYSWNALVTQYGDGRRQYYDQTPSIDNVLHSNSTPASTGPPLSVLPPRAYAQHALGMQLSSPHPFPGGERSYAGEQPPPSIGGAYPYCRETFRIKEEIPSSGGELAYTDEHPFAGENPYSAEQFSAPSLLGPRADGNSVSSAAWTGPNPYPQARELTAPPSSVPLPSRNTSTDTAVTDETIDPRMLESMSPLDGSGSISPPEGQTSTPLEGESATSETTKTNENREPEEA